MGFKVNFLDNQEVTAEDLNGIGASLTGTAYTTFEDGVPYGVDDLNEIVQNLMNPGVKKGAGNECNVSVSGGKVVISSGTGFFGNGAIITIDNSGIELDYDASVMNYVYLFLSEAGNIGGAKASEEITETDYILLATVTGTTVTDERQYAVMKNASAFPNQYGELTVNVSIPHGESVEIDLGELTGTEGQFKNVVIGILRSGSGYFQNDAIGFYCEAGRFYYFGYGIQSGVWTAETEVEIDQSIYAYHTYVKYDPTSGIITMRYHSGDGRGTKTGTYKIYCS